jgi:nicotinamide N-methyltransferase
MLTDKIRLSGPDSNDPEDIIFSSLGVIFPDDITNQHGDRDHPVIYVSPTFGSITLTLADPQGEDNRRLFSHFLWNAGLQLAEFIEEEDQDWRVKGEKVLELGAGTGLAGIVAANIKNNVKRNIGSQELKGQIGEVGVEGHEWGVLNDRFSAGYKETFSRVLVADCLWMPWQHENLLRSIRWFLTIEGKAWIVAGFHTGREKMRGFYEKGLLDAVGLEIERIWERNAEGAQRPWSIDRGIEDITERKRWLVIAILKRRE